MNGPTENWTRAILCEGKKSTLALPENIEMTKPTDEAAVFELIELGPDVKKLKQGDKVIASFMSGVMKFRLPETDISTYAIRETDVIYVLPRK